MPSMFAEPDLDAFQRLRCAFDPHGLANPGKVMPTPRLCGEVPGPYREHPLERAGHRGAVLVSMPPDAQPRRRSRTPPRRSRAPTAEGRRVRIVGAGTKLGWGSRRADAGHRAATPPGWIGSLEHNAGDLTAILQAGVPLARRPSATFAAAGQMLALDPPLGLRAEHAATIGGVRRHRRQRAAAPPLRRAAGPGRRRDRRAQRRDDRPLRREGDQERRRLRPGQAVRRVVRDARADPVGQRPPASAARDQRDRARGDRGRSDVLAAAARRSPAAPLELEALDVAWRGGRGGLLARCAGPEPGRRAQRAARADARGRPRAGRA